MIVSKLLKMRVILWIIDFDFIIELLIIICIIKISSCYGNWRVYFISLGLIFPINNINSWSTNNHLMESFFNCIPRIILERLTVIWYDGLGLQLQEFVINIISKIRDNVLNVFDFIMERRVYRIRIEDRKEVRD
jgi:hypothetical protein